MLCRLARVDREGSVYVKEPQFFNRFPLPPTGNYLGAWNATELAAMRSEVPRRRILYDGSPQYLMTAAAPARIKAAAPHARFVVIVRVRIPHFSA